jgi:hypothetical protein
MSSSISPQSRISRRLAPGGPASHDRPRNAVSPFATAKIVVWPATCSVRGRLIIAARSRDACGDATLCAYGRRGERTSDRCHRDEGSKCLLHSRGLPACLRHSIKRGAADRDDLQDLLAAGDLPVGRLVDRRVESPLQKYFASPVGQIISTNSRHPTPPQGRIAIVTDAGWDAVDAAAFCARGDRRAGR